MSRIDAIDLTEAHDSGASEAPKLLAVPQLDPEEYRADLADLGMSEAQETEFLQTLWSIMGTFARMGFTVDVCGTIFEDFNEASAPESDDGKLTFSTGKGMPSNDGDDA